MAETEIENAPPMDEKAKRTRELLASFYATDPSSGARSVPVSPRRVATLDSINSPSFDPDIYMNLLIQKTNLEGLLHKHVEMAAEIKNLDTDLQMLVYENYNKFISATDTIKRMKNNIVGMETNMEQLLEKIVSVQSKSDGVNTSLFAKREKIEKLHRTRNFLRKIQFIYDLPARLQKCIESEAYADAVRLFIGSKPIFEAYGDSSFHICKLSSEEAIELVIENLKGKLFSDSEPIEARAEAVVLLKQLNFPVEDLKNKMLDNLEEFLLNFNTKKSEETINTKTGELNKGEDISDLADKKSSTQASIIGFSKTVNAYRIIFPDSEKRLIELTQDLFTKCYETIQLEITKRSSSEALICSLRDIWSDVSVMDEVLPDAALPAICLEASRVVVEKFISNAFSTLLLNASEALTGAQTPSKGADGNQILRAALESSKKAVIQGSMDCLLDFRHFLDDTFEIITKMRDLIIDWVQEGFQNFFKSLNRHFLSLCGKLDQKNQAVDAQKLRAEKMQTGLVLVLAQLSVFIEQTAIPSITEEIAASFSGGGLRGYEYGPAFVPGEICRLFRSASSDFLQIYITLRSQKISTLLKKRFMTPNWIKHKEPREVHMFVDLLLHELHDVGAEVRQILPYGPNQRHHRTESVGSGNSSRSNQMKEDKLNRSNTQRARSQLLESHLAKLFEQKMEIFTKIEHTEESVVSAITKLSLKSIQELVQLQTLNRSGYQQIQLDMEFLKTPLKDIVHDEAVIDFLLKEVNNSAHERCLDPVPLEAPIIDKLIQAKLTKNKDSPSK